MDSCDAHGHDNIVYGEVNMSLLVLPVVRKLPTAC